MVQVPAKLSRMKPKNGLAHVFHLVLTLLLPILVYVMVRIHFAQIALLLILISKWRMFAVKPRHWPANIRANAIDIIVGVSILVFMTQSGSQLLQLTWAVAYAVWLLFIKPGSSVLYVSAQALIGQFAGLAALFLIGNRQSIFLNTAVLVVATWAICYLAARHFLASFDEPQTRFFSYLWGYFGAALVWLLSHWLLFYGPIAQPALLISVIGFGLATLYYLQETDRLSTFFQRQILFIMFAIVIILILFSDWGDKTI
jgi:peptidoglycan/LPS O-acetylase OafA/YrhL